MSLLTEATERHSRIVHIQALIDSGAAQVRAYRNAKTGELASIDIVIWTENLETARELVARFPKSLRMRGTTCSGSDYFDHEVSDPRYKRTWHSPRTGDWSHSWETGYVHLQVHCTADGVNKGTNEAGIKRYRSFLKNAGKLGIPVQFVTEGHPQYVQSEAELEQLLAS